MSENGQKWYPKNEKPTYTPTVYTILISSDLKNQKVVIHPPSTTDHPPPTIKIKKKSPHSKV